MINNGYEIQGYYGKVPPWIGFGKGCVPGAVSGPAVVCFEAIARLALFAGMEARFSTLPSSSWINRLACKDMYWVRETYMVKDLTKLPWSKGISLHFSLPSGEKYKDHTITTTGEKRLYVTMNSCDKPINANYLTLRIQRRTLGGTVQTTCSESSGKNHSFLISRRNSIDCWRLPDEMRRTSLRQKAITHRLPNKCSRIQLAQMRLFTYATSTLFLNYGIQGYGSKSETETS